MNFLIVNFFTNSFLQLEKHKKQCHDVVGKETEEILPNNVVKNYHKGRPRICDSEIKCFKTMKFEMILETLPTKRKGRPKKIRIQDENIVPRKRGRPKKILNEIEIK